MFVVRFYVKWKFRGFYFLLEVVKEEEETNVEVKVDFQKIEVGML